jgi:SAM-dependent methyltransferase
VAIDFERLYAYRFRDVRQDQRAAVWREISGFLYRDVLGSPRAVLDPASGRCEFINAVPAAERWCVDAVDHAEWRDPAVQFTLGDTLEVELPGSHFDGVFVSNFLEHLPDPTTVAVFLAKMRAAMRPGGRIAVLGPNFRYCAREYFDCADHILALTHLSVEEHLYAAGFEIERSVARFLPFSFRGLLPPSAALTRFYLRMSPAWTLLGKQFLVVATKPTAA